MTREYLAKRFPRASLQEREHIVNDWLGKEEQAEGIARDFEVRAMPLADKRILDAGSGNGGISIALAKHGASVEGVDIEEDLIDIARTVNASDRVHFTCYDGTTLPFADRSFDGAISVSVLEHVSDPARFLSEIARVTKPGGLLYLALPNRLYPRETHTQLWGLSYLPRPLAQLYARVAGRSPLEDQNLHFYTYFGVLRLARVAGWKLRNEEGKTTHGLKYFAKRLLRALGIPHQALLPHVMLILEAS